MNTFSEELISARNAKGCTLAEISNHTRINIKYLEAIDQGLFDILPQTYIRAFLKQYAEYIGLNSDDILKKYEIMVLGDKTVDTNEPIVGSAFSIETEELINIEDSQGKKQDFNSAETKTDQEKRKYFYVTIISIAIILILVYIATFIFNTTEDSKVKETPFEEIIKKEIPQKEKSIATDTSTVEKILPVAEEKIQSDFFYNDSLYLKTVANNDTVWVNIKSDNLRSRSAYLIPREERIWHAKEKFTITCGNAGSITIELNGKSLGTLGKRGAVARNLELTRKDLDLE